MNLTDYANGMLLKRNEWEAEFKAKEDVEKVKKATKLLNKYLGNDEIYYTPEIKSEGEAIIADGLKIRGSDYENSTPHALQIFGSCPTCGKEVWSVNCFSLADIGEQIKSFYPEADHRSTCDAQDRKTEE